ncbi:MAG: response regulator [Vicinamibacterales bacterium]
MPEILRLDDNTAMADRLRKALHRAGYAVSTVSSDAQSLRGLMHGPIELMVIDLRLPGGSRIEILRQAPSKAAGRPAVIVTGFDSVKDAVEAIRIGVVDVVGKPVSDDGLLHVVHGALAAGERWPPGPAADGAVLLEAHAAARWSRVVVQLIDSPHDPRTFVRWGGFVGVSPRALRSWCRAAGLAPRRSLVFGRLLRAVCHGAADRQSLANVLDVVDRRTLSGLLALSGFGGPNQFPTNAGEFLDRQTLVTDPTLLLEVRRAMAKRKGGPALKRCGEDDGR